MSLSAPNPLEGAVTVGRIPCERSPLEGILPGMLDHPLVQRVVGGVVILALLGGAVWVLERVFGDADK